MLLSAKLPLYKCSDIYIISKTQTHIKKLKQLLVMHVTPNIVLQLLWTSCP